MKKNKQLRAEIVELKKQLDEAYKQNNEYIEELSKAQRKASVAACLYELAKSEPEWKPDDGLPDHIFGITYPGVILPGVAGTTDDSE